MPLEQLQFKRQRGDQVWGTAGETEPLYTTSMNENNPALW